MERGTGQAGLDRATGRLRWSMGAEEADRTALQGYSVASEPAVSEGLVLAVASRYEVQHTVSFLALDASTGRLVWHRPLGWGQQETNLFGAPVKELAASPPAVADGAMIAATAKRHSNRSAR